MLEITTKIFDKPYEVTLSAIGVDNSRAELGTTIVMASTKYAAMTKAMDILWYGRSDVACCMPSAVIKPATCQYFHEDYVGFCGAAVFPYVPSISELEGKCFKDFLACPIYNEFQDVNALAAAKS